MHQRQDCLGQTDHLSGVSHILRFISIRNSGKLWFITYYVLEKKPSYCFVRFGCNACHRIAIGTVGKRDWQVMTRLQNAEKQLSDALVAFESAVESVIEASASNAVAALPSTVDFAALIDEVSGIEAKLGEAMQVIADIDVAQTSAANAGNTGDSQ